MKLRMLSLCTGIGGSDISAEMTGQIQVVGQVERDPYCLQVLAQQFPDVPRMNDIKEVQGHEFGHIDICIIGLPCQPHSLAGKRRGASDERNIWPAFQAILQRQRDRGEPYKWVIIENVRGLLSSRGERYTEKGGMFFEIIQEMAELGYRMGWSVYAASEVGAPHRRERVFIVAYHDSYRLRQRPHQSQLLTKCELQTINSQNSANVDNPQSIPEKRLPSRAPAPHPITGEPGRSELRDTRGMAHTKGEECTATRIRSGSAEVREVPDLRSTDSGADVAHTNGERWAEGQPKHEVFKGSVTTTISRSAGVGQADACEQRLQERKRSADQGGTCTNLDRSQQREGKTKSEMGGIATGLSNRLDAYQSHKWPSRPGEPQHSWEPPRVIPPDEKLPNRVAQLKALGNTIVPQQLYLLLNEIVKFEQAQATQEVSA